MSRVLGQNTRRRSEAVLARLSALEAQPRDGASEFPVALAHARGARVRDADGNHYIDLTSFFGVAAVGHRHPRVLSALREQVGRLPHALGDVHPADVTARLLRAVAARLPAPDYRAVLSLNGADAVETALKFAAAATGRAGFVAFRGAYHGLSLGALEATQIDAFRAPFACMLSGRSRAVPFPAADGSDLAAVLQQVREAVAAPGAFPVGAVIVEPIQGRGGIRVPPAGFLRELQTICRNAGTFLVADEVLTGVHRTGPFLRSGAEGVVPDAVCLGKALGGGVPLSGCWMRPALADAVRREGGEAPHTWTFLGNPLGCAAALGVLAAVDRGHLAEAAPRIEATVRAAADGWARRTGLVADVRGAGALVGVALRGREGRTAGELAGRVCGRALRDGVLLLAEGPAGDVLALVPPLSIPSTDLDRALAVVGRALEAEAT